MPLFYYLISIAEEVEISKQFPEIVQSIKKLGSSHFIKSFSIKDLKNKPRLDFAIHYEYQITKAASRHDLSNIIHLESIFRQDQRLCYY